VANTVVRCFICPVCEERRMKEVGVNNAFLATKVVEFCKKGHEMKLDRTEER
jgi:hypothetical protein